jgi:hypothetical protein
VEAPLTGRPRKPPGSGPPKPLRREYEVPAKARYRLRVRRPFERSLNLGGTSREPTRPKAWALFFTPQAKRGGVFRVQTCASQESGDAGKNHADDGSPVMMQEEEQ